MGGLAKVAVLLVVAPQQVHIMHLALILLDHVHQMFLQVRRIHLDTGKKAGCPARVHTNSTQTQTDGQTVPPAACRSDRPESTSCTWRCGTARPETSGPGRESAQTKSKRDRFIRADRKLRRGNRRASAVPVRTHVSCGLFITEHVGVGGHDGRPRLLRDAGGLRGSFALVHQLLHGVCDALVT